MPSFELIPNNQVYIFLFGTALASAVILLNYVQKKKKKQDEERKNEYLKCKSLFDFERLAEKLLMSHRFYYYNYKTGQGHTFQACRDYFEKKLRIMPRILVDVTNISLKTTIFGCTYESPILIAPTGFHCLAHVDGEIGTARGAAEAECVYIYNWLYSTMSQDKVLETAGPKFLHVYLNIPIEILEKIVSEADKNGYLAIVITCDDPTHRIREFVFPLFQEASQKIDSKLFQIMAQSNMKVLTTTHLCLDRTSVTWANVERLRKLTKLPIICKGILSPIDAELAIQCGANGIVVSNHGGRQVDTTVPAIECLEDIINVVDGRAEVFVDTGIRSGTDVLKALALGARAVFIGRPVIYGLAVGGHDGVRTVLEMLKRELTYDMACCGLTSIDRINKDILYKHQ